MLICCKDGLPAFLRDGYGHNLAGKRLLFLGTGPPLLAPCGELVLLGAGNPVFFSQVFGRNPHVAVVKTIPQPIEQQHVLNLAVP